MSDLKKGTIVIGIDLGTTNSLVSVPDSKEKPTIIPNDRGERKTPSVVTIQTESILIGELAKSQAVLNHESTVLMVKRYMGTDKTWEINGKEWKACDISSEILKNLRAIAETYIGKEVDDAVITVPAYFNDSQREETLKAAEKAGLKVHKLFNEPTAAALAYGLQKSENDQLLVFDFGGGTLDITLLEVKNGAFLVRGVGGDSKLGGIDFDKIIVEYARKNFMDIHKIDLLKDPMAYQQLLNQAESAKIDISSVPETKIMIPYITVTKKGPLHLNINLSRKTFNKLAEPILEKIKHILEDTLKSSGLPKDWPKSVVLVGGTSRIPCVKDLLKDFLHESIIFKQDLNPEEIVAVGAGVLAGIINKTYPEVVIKDIVSHDLGIEDDSGEFVTIIERGEVYPIQKSRLFTTTNDNQAQVAVHVQEKNVIEDRCNSLGYFVVEGFKEAKAGELDIPVTFEIDENGILRVSIEEEKSKIKKEVEFKLMGDLV